MSVVWHANMFEDLRQAFREAVDNFKDELGRDDVPEAVSRLLREMKREAADTKAEIRRLEEAIRGAIEGAEKSESEGKTCRRREQMAADISDEETARRGHRAGVTGTSSVGVPTARVGGQELRGDFRDYWRESGDGEE